MTIVLAPDIEKMVSTFLRSHPNLSSMSARVVGKTPADTESAPWVRVTQINSPSINVADHLIEFMVQFDCYATTSGGQPQANLLARTVRAALSQEFAGPYADGVVNGAEVLGAGRIPDTDYEPARERVVITALIWAHA